MRRAISRGTPQGGVPCPLLWILAINKLQKSLEESRICVVAYADNVALAVRGRLPNTLCEVEVDKWSTSYGLGVNATKTERVLFTRKHYLPDVRPPTLHTNIIVNRSARIQRTANLRIRGKQMVSN